MAKCFPLMSVTLKFLRLAQAWPLKGIGSSLAIWVFLWPQRFFFSELFGSGKLLCGSKSVSESGCCQNPQSFCFCGLMFLLIKMSLELLQFGRFL